MVNVEKTKEDLIKKIKENNMEEALDMLLQLIGIVEDKSTETLNESEIMLKTLLDFYALGSSANPESFLKLQAGDVIHDSQNTFKVLSVLNHHTFILKHDNVSMKFVVTYSFDLDELSVGFAGNAYIYDGNKVVAEIPNENLQDIFSF